MGCLVCGLSEAVMWDSFGALPTRSWLVHTLVEAEKQYGAQDNWPALYAELLLGTLPDS